MGLTKIKNRLARLRKQRKGKPSLKRFIRTKKTELKAVMKTQGGGGKMTKNDRRKVRAQKTSYKTAGTYSKAKSHGQKASAEYYKTGKVTEKGQRELYKMKIAGERLATQERRRKRLERKIK
mgnify:CR=1 FL=1